MEIIKETDRTVLALTFDLAGCADGPEDLSTNPAYLEEAYAEKLSYPTRSAKRRTSRVVPKT
jgi:hypothetical protein